MTFPLTPSLDDFNRSTGALGVPWSCGFFAPLAEALIFETGRMGSCGSARCAQWDIPFGANQEAWYRVSTGSPRTHMYIRLQDLLDRTYLDGVIRDRKARP